MPTLYLLVVVAGGLGILTGEGSFTFGGLRFTTVARPRVDGFGDLGWTFGMDRIPQ